MVDTLGLVLEAFVSPADMQDRDGARQVLAQATWDFARLRTVWADRAYTGRLIDWVRCHCPWALQIVPPRRSGRGFAVEPKRWIIERTFAWLDRYRRFTKDYEYLPDSSESMVYAAMTHLMLRRLAN